MFSVLNSDGAILFEPPKKISKSFYVCDKRFHLDSILEMYKEEHVNGIVFVTGDFYAGYKIIKTGNHLVYKKLFGQTDVHLPNRHNKGGQSSLRFAKIVKEMHQNYISKLSEQVIEHFMKNKTEYLINKLIIAGCGEKKYLLSNNSLIQQYFNDRLILINIANTNDEIIHQTIQSTINIFNQDKDNYYDKILDNIQDLMITNSDKLVFGFDDVIESINIFELEKIIIDESLKDMFNELELCKTELILIPSYKINKSGLNIIGIKWY
ncbi:eukaryotic peptide chain release factor subunit 1 [Klosneuvirus KNV1]|uniref:Eukaryotic peptide chain release factor subunit 1 n=1 Tax=Klosneuvirus KNV1 TaxID=1977640 RepID=A0A1V0SI83_9VIRU|nr:eukaryotic peptide chain release factor subunit 1 [Klosneuvirus KNV1]